ncbi:MAG: hypothetical protein KatS3mg110_3926 [Pirellulaceae bacterium]|nr:MAG: hypothetical protein KatS3mg110_3926 [Pirellulaceae bacterium]
MVIRGQQPADPADSGSATVSYYKEIRPIFQEHCQGCHQPAKRGGGYVMTRFDLLLQGGESGEPAIVPGKPEESYLVRQITPENGKAEMPQGGQPLPEPLRAKIIAWIAQGAVDDSPPATANRYDMEHPPEYPAPPVITALDFSPDGTQLAISGYHEVVIRSSDGQQLLARLVGLSERIESIAYSPDGQRLAVTGGSPGRLGELQIWQVAEKQLLLSKIIDYDTLYGVSWSPDGSLVAFGCPDHTARAVMAETGEQVFYNGAHNDWVLDTVFSVKGDHLITVSRDMSMKLIHVPTQRFIDNITSITPGALKGGLDAVDRHPTEEQVVTGGADGTPRIYRIFREKARQIGDDFNLIRAFEPMPGRVFDVAFNRDGKLFVAGSSDDMTGEVRVYQVDDGKIVIRHQFDSGVYAVAFHPSGQWIAAGGFDGVVRLIKVPEGEVVSEFLPVPLSVATGNAATELTAYGTCGS